ncbi:MAG: ABC transporter substrate-binding protein, partial [Nitrososphaerales archaeon]
MSSEKKVDRRVYLKYIGSFIIGAVIFGGGIAAYYASLPAAKEVITKTITETVPGPTITKTVTVTATPTPMPTPTPTPTPKPTPVGAIKIGLLASLTGPFAPAGALAMARGMVIAIEMVNDRGGVEGYKIDYVMADAMSSPDTAVKETERLITVEGVVAVNGVYSSAIAIPVSEICEKLKTPFFDVVAISDEVTAREFEYTFRIQPRGSAWGEGTAEFTANVITKKMGKDVKDLRVAVIYEDGPYGVSVQDKNVWVIKKYGMNLVHHEAYSHKATDLSPMILKLKRADPDVILHTGYFPDIVLFLKQSKELGLKTYAYLGHGAGHANPPLLAESVGRELVNYIFNIDPAPCQLLDKKRLGIDPYYKVPIGDLIDEFLSRYDKKHGEKDPPTHATQGFAHTWVLLTDIIPRAIKKYG